MQLTEGIMGNCHHGLVLGVLQMAVDARCVEGRPNDCGELTWTSVVGPSSMSIPSFLRFYCYCCKHNPKENHFQTFWVTLEGCSEDTNEWLARGTSFTFQTISTHFTLLSCQDSLERIITWCPQVFPNFRKLFINMAQQIISILVNIY